MKTVYSIEILPDAFDNTFLKMKPVIMGISGGTGSGKTFIANQIKKSFEKNGVWF